MTTQKIIAEIEAMPITDSEDFAPLERLDILADELAQTPGAYSASLIQLLERHPAAAGTRTLKNGTLRTSIMNRSEVLTYTIAHDTLRINNRGGQPNEPLLLKGNGTDEATLCTLKNEAVYRLKRAAK